MHLIEKPLLRFSVGLLIPAELLFKIVITGVDNKSPDQ